jgi:phosphatidylserine decarboxylase
VLSGFFFPYATPLLVLVLAFAFYFFRDPARTVPDGPRLLVAPADGRITEITECDDGTLGGPVRRVSIFLSLFDVHMNRAPCSGRVASTAYQRGEFRSALTPQSSLVNESNTVVIESDELPGLMVLVKQIAGVIARRIVCDCAPGKLLARGERFGMIKFGSRTELCVPSERVAQLRVKPGDAVRAGTTVIGVMK